MSSDSPRKKPEPTTDLLPAVGQPSAPLVPTLIRTGTAPTVISAAGSAPRPHISDDDGIDATVRSQPGSMALLGRYEVRRELARGGMGRVLIAYDRRLKREVAVKECLAPDEQAKERFEREVLVTAGLQHPSIVTIHEAGTSPGGEPFYVMPQVPGRSLHDAIAAAPTLADRLALLPQVIAACEALAYAHDRGVIHRDLKPANILVGAFGETVVIDWGLARELGMGDDLTAPPGSGGLPPVMPTTASSPGLTAVGTVVGTPDYMAPEQARGQPLDARCDVYALGAILWHLLTGGPAYTGNSAIEIMEALVDGPPEEPDWTGVPADLVDIVRKAMAHDPADRYPTAQALVADLRRFQSGKLVGAHRYSKLELMLRWMQKNRLLLAVALVDVVLLTAVGGVSLRRVLESRRVAEREREAATVARDEAERLEINAEQDRQDSILQQARGQAERDPAGTLRLIRELSPRLGGWNEARLAAEEALASGVPAWQLETPGISVHFALHDGHRLAVGLRDGRVLIFDTRTQQIRVLGKHNAGVVDLTPSPDDRFLISSAQDGSLVLWDLERGTSVPMNAGPDASRGSVFLSDGTVAAVTNSYVSFLDPSTGKEQQRLRDFDDAVAFSRAHAVLVRAGAQATLYDRLGPPRSFHLGADWGFGSLSTDRQTLIVSDPVRGVALVNTTTGQLDLLPGLEKPVPDEHDVLDSGGSVVLTGRHELGVWDAHRKGPRRVSVDCTARDVGALRGSQVRLTCDEGLELIDVESGARRFIPMPQSSRAGTDGSGQLVMLSLEDTLLVWDVGRLGAGDIDLPEPIDSMYAARHSPRAVAIGGGAHPGIYDLDVDHRSWRLLGHAQGPVHFAALALDGSLLAYVENEADMLRWLDLSTGRASQSPLKGPKDVDISADGKTIVVGGEDEALRVDVPSGVVLHLPTGGAVSWVEAAADGAVVTQDRATTRFDVWGRDGKKLRELGSMPAGTNAASDDGRTLVHARASSELDVWSSDDWSHRTLPSVGVGGVADVQTTAGGDAVVEMLRDGSLWLRRLDGSADRRVGRFPALGLAIEVSPDGNRVAAIDHQGNVSVMDLATAAIWRFSDPRGAFEVLERWTKGPLWLTARGAQVRIWSDDLPAEPEALLKRIDGMPVRVGLPPAAQ